MYKAVHSFRLNVCCLSFVTAYHRGGFSRSSVTGYHCDSFSHSCSCCSTLCSILCSTCRTHAITNTDGPSCMQPRTRRRTKRLASSSWYYSVCVYLVVCTLRTWPTPGCGSVLVPRHSGQIVFAYDSMVSSCASHCSDVCAEGVLVRLDTISCLSRCSWSCSTW
jgi:hypothetical protein